MRYGYATRTIQVILRHQKEGFPSTAIREIRALRALQNHPNVAWAAPAAFDGDAYGICMICDMRMGQNCQNL